MKKIDYTAVDGRLLRTFLFLLEEKSVSSTADRLGVTQSTVSHALARLRGFIGDPLFVRSGHVLQPTEVALSLKEPTQSVLDGLRGLSHRRAFNPMSEDMHFVVAANDMQRDLIFPGLLRDLENEGVSARFEFIPSGHPTAGMLREDRCHLALTPFPPDGSDIVQKRLLAAKMMCFFDGHMRDAPTTWEAYCSAEHISVRFPDGGTSLRALTGVDKTGIPEAKVSVPNFNSILPFVKGTRLLSTGMVLMKLFALKDLHMAPLPVESDAVSIYMVWHMRGTNDPAHIWLRQRVETFANGIMEQSASLL